MHEWKKFKKSKIAIRGIQRNGSGSNRRPSDSRGRMDIFWENTFELQVYKVPAYETKLLQNHLLSEFSIWWIVMAAIQMLDKQSP